MIKLSNNEIILLYLLLIYVITVTCNDCIGKYHIHSSKSPSTILERNLSSLSLIEFDKPPLKTTFENNGHTVVVKYSYKGSRPKLFLESISRDTYHFEFLQYNWLSNSKDKTRFAELHFIFRNERYKNYEEAVRHHMGIAIISYGNMVLNLPVTDMDSYYNALDLIAKPKTSTIVEYPHIAPLYHFGLKSSNYFMYLGKSISRPEENGKVKCYADALWFDFSHNILVNISQARHFENLLAIDGTPLMTKTLSYSPPNSSIYKAVDLLSYERTGLKAKLFEGFPSNNGVLRSTNLSLFISIIMMIILYIFYKL